MQRTIEVNDVLDDQIASAIADVKQELLNYLESNPDTDTLPDLGNDLDYSGAIHEIIDGAVPIYTHDIKTAWFLYGSELRQAYENAGCGENPMENEGMAAIYYYISDKVAEWYHHNAKEVFNAWKEAKEARETQSAATCEEL